MSIYDKSSLVLIPSGTKTGKVFSQKPVSGDGDFTFTRASAATRVNASGFIEKETMNLFRYSEEFNQSPIWFPQANAQISANAATAPNGTTTADLLYPLVNNSIVAAIQQITSVSNVQYTQSVYVKASGKNFAALYTFNGFTGAAMWVNLTTGAITNGVGSSVSGRFATSVGNGWWRIGFADLGNGTTCYMHLYPTEAAGVNSVTANGTDGILVWGGQLNYGSVAQDYIKTTTTALYGGITDNVPRLDYTDSSCPALLLEPQRSNILTNSEYFAAWIQFNTLNTSNALTSPEGVQNANKLIAASGVNNNVIYQGLSAGTYTASIFAKKGEFEGLVMATGTTGAFFNLNTNTYRNFYASPPTSYNIEDYGNGWHRYSITFTQGGADNLYIGPNDNVSNSLGVTGNNSDGIYIYGAQMESASYATSYIPTYGTSVTRNAEAAYKTGISSLIGGVEGTIFFDIKTNKTLTSTNYKQFFYYSDSSSAQSYMYISGNNYIVGNPNLGNIVSGQIIQADTRYKIAITYKENDFKLYINGSLSATRTSGSVIDAVDITSIGSYSGVSEFNEFKFNSYMHFQEVLTNEELATLTTI